MSHSQGQKVIQRIGGRKSQPRAMRSSNLSRKTRFEIQIALVRKRCLRRPRQAGRPSVHATPSGAGGRKESTRLSDVIGRVRGARRAPQQSPRAKHGQRTTGSIVVTSAAPVLARKVDFRMDYALLQVSMGSASDECCGGGLLPCGGSRRHCGRRSSPRRIVRIEPFACARCGSCPRAG